MASAFGSHATMVCDDTILQDTLLGWKRILKGELLLKDGDGYYATTPDKLDTGLADPNRYDGANRL